MGKLFGGGADDSALKAQQEKLAQQEARLAAEEATADKKKKSAKAAKSAQLGRSGKASLLSGLETGITPESAGKRGNLG